MDVSMNAEILSSEAWRPILGFEGVYAVSAYGEVYSFSRGRRLKPYADRDGYPRVTLVQPGPGKLVERKKHPRVHRLVAEAFHGEYRNALHCEAAHLDGNRANACADNLKWVSKVENHSHKRLHGTNQAGELHHGAKLTTEKVSVIIADLAAGVPMYRLAARFGVSYGAIDSIRRGKNWRHMPRPAGLQRLRRANGGQHGERNHWAKLTMQQAQEIRALRGEKTCRELGKQFGVSIGAISRIWRNESYAR